MKFTPVPPRESIKTTRGKASLAFALSLCCSFLVGGWVRAQKSFDPAQSDPKAVQLADQVMEALGGQKAWQETHYIRFNFFGVRTHYWDKYTGRHRVEGKTREGDSFVVLDNINTQEGKAWRNGKELSGKEAEKFLKLSYGAWVNDTYWLLMPYKMKDPGVVLKDAGTEKVGNLVYQKIQLSFDHVGLTPGDRYWAYINPQTHLMDQWAYILQSMDPKGPATQWRWEDWKKYGNIMLASKRVNVKSGGARTLSDIGVFDSLPDSVFTSPSPVQLER